MTYFDFDQLWLTSEVHKVETTAKLPTVKCHYYVTVIAQG